MKKLNFLFFLLLFTLVGCEKANNNTVAPAQIDVQNPVNLNALIIGKWQLSEIGTVYTTSSSGGCNSDGASTHDEINWSRTQTAETLDFKENGEFTKDLNKDALCKGTYQINYSNLMTKSDCGQSNAEQPIDVLNKTKMTLTVQQDNTEMKYRYVKL